MEGKDSANSDAILVWRNRNTGNLESKIEDKNRWPGARSYRVKRDTLPSIGAKISCQNRETFNAPNTKVESFGKTQIFGPCFANDEK